MEEEKILTLRKPLKLGDIEYTAFTLREPTAGELAKAENNAAGNTDVAINLISYITGVPRKAIEQLCQRDFQEASDFLGGFTVPAQTTGSESSPS